MRLLIFSLLSVFLSLSFGKAAFAGVSFATMEGIAVQVAGEEIRMNRYETAVKLAEDELFAETSVRTGEVSTYEALEREERVNLVRVTVLQQLIDSILIERGAMDEGIVVEEADIRLKIDELKAKFPSSADFHRSIAEQNMTVEDLKKNILRQLIVEGLQELMMARLVVSDEEIEEFYDHNLEIFVDRETGKKTTLKQAKGNIRSFLLKEKGYIAFSGWLEDRRMVAEIVINESLRDLVEPESTLNYLRRFFNHSLT
jgi:hypothetical protein